MEINILCGEKSYKLFKDFYYDNLKLIDSYSFIINYRNKLLNNNSNKKLKYQDGEKIDNYNNKIIEIILIMKKDIFKIVTCIIIARNKINDENINIIKDTVNQYSIRSDEIHNILNSIKY